MTGSQCGGFEVDDVALAGLAEVWAQGGAEVTKVGRELAALLGRVRLLDVDAAACPASAQIGVRNAAAALAEAEQTANALSVALAADSQGLAQCARNYQDADNCVQHHIDTVVPAPAPAPGPPQDSNAGTAAGSAQIQAWIGQAFAVLEASGVPAEQLDPAGVLLIIEHESGGNPDAINEWDSNWRAGHASKGLMQCIDSTFDEYRLPGHGDIFNPVDNIIAGVRYAISRYGSISNVPGVKAVAEGSSYVGY